MGIVIFTDDDEKFLVGKYVLMTGVVDTPPSDPDTTYILRTNRFTEKQVVEWLPYIGKRLVVTIVKQPKITSKTEDNVILDYKRSRTPNKYGMDITAILAWTDRKRVWHTIQGLPIPYAFKLLRPNTTDCIDFWRLIAKANMEMDDDYVRAIFAYGLEGNRRQTKWEKKTKVEDEAPHPFRQSDKYWKEIVATIKNVANEVRSTGGELPKGMRKTKEASDKWI